jgi:hypothetical protein
MYIDRINLSVEHNHQLREYIVGERAEQVNLRNKMQRRGWRLR